MWDQRYGVPEYVYGTDPNDYLAGAAGRIPTGSVVCLGAGEGRNAVFLAERGHDVEAVDASAVGLAKAQKLAAAHSVEIRTTVADLADYDLGQQRWDGAVMIFCHLPAPLRRRVHHAVVAGLKPGGVLLMEAYTPRQLGRKTGGPPTLELLYEPDVLREEFGGLEFDRLVELVRPVREGILHSGEAAVVQISASKPPGATSDHIKTTSRVA